MRTYGVVPEIRVPHIPLHLGSTAQAVQSVSAIGAKVAGSAIASAASSAGWGAAAGPIGAAAAVAIGIIVGLIAAHEQRLHDAKDENSAASKAVSGFYSIVQQIVSDYNAGKLGATDAIAQLQNLDQATYQGLRSHVGKPGTSWSSSQPGVCNKSCTVGCCLYNTYLHQDLYGGGKQGVIPVIQAGGGTLNVAGIPSNKYGFPSMAKISLTINPPSATAGIDSAVSSVESALGGGSIVPLLLIGGAAFLLLR